MRAAAKILFIFLIIAACAVAAFIFSRGSFSRELFGFADSGFILRQLQKGSRSNVSDYFDRLAGSCAKSSGYALFTAAKALSLSSQSVFPFYLPIGINQIGNAQPLTCALPDGRQINIKMLSETRMVISRMIGRPFTISIAGGGGFEVSGTNLNFVWHSEFGEVEITSSGPAKAFAYSILMNSRQTLGLVAQKGELQAKKLKSVTDKVQEDRVLELNATEGSSITWEVPANQVTAKTKGLVLPSGFQSVPLTIRNQTIFPRIR